MKKHKTFRLGVLALTVVLAFSLAGCWEQEKSESNKPNSTPSVSSQNAPAVSVPPETSFREEQSRLKNPNTYTNDKPVIYLYPEKETQVSVRLDFDGELTCTYPAYQNGWNVTAYPDGRLIDQEGKEYSYLFWEGTATTEYDLSKGFVVKGSDTAVFLQEKLSFLGLTPKEYNEFIVYWLPKMQENPYNLITFQGKAYTDSAQLTITPEPDRILRIFMAYCPLSEKITVEEPVLHPFERDRSGFTVVEWGGTTLPAPNGTGGR